MSNKIKKACLAFALTAVVGAAFTATACSESKHPEVTISISFNGSNFDIDYTLSRNMYPQTVQHFIELADSGFYNNTIIHNYTSSDWIGGAYNYDDNAETGYVASYSKKMGIYLESNCKEEAYHALVKEGYTNGKFTPSVYSREVYDSKGNPIVKTEDALTTLIGEFSANGHRIEDDKGLKAGLGTLKMVYYEKEQQTVTVKTSYNEILPRDYAYNCATSLFSMQMSSSTAYSETKYCVFGQLKDESAREVFDDLKEAVSDYSKTLTSSSALTTSIETIVDRADPYAEEGGKDIEKTFAIISMPIVITKITVTKR